jgi:hypothetical protein
MLATTRYHRSMSAKTKGLGFTNALTFADQEFGPDGAKRLIDSFSLDEQALLLSMIPAGWYDLEFYARFLRQLALVHGGGTFALIEEYGRFAAKRDINTVYKLLFRITSPGLIFDQAMKLWGRFHDSGVWRVERGERTATGVLSNWGVVDEVLCRELIGYIETTLTHGNCKRAHLEHPECRARGAPDCVFTGVWQ